MAADLAREFRGRSGAGCNADGAELPGDFRRVGAHNFATTCLSLRTASLRLRRTMVKPSPHSMAPIHLNIRQDVSCIVRTDACEHGASGANSTTASRKYGAAA